ncbi:hypothetical protein ACH50O_21015 [Methylomonas sp. 2BW1-5-20]|uniref:hypothetical protein n=1 Tax=Methylomonas sp. 2BW1-5-20 TaxID=3376686 RepID=UPI00404D1BF4
MLRLSGGTSYFLLAREGEKKYRVEIRDSFSEVFHNWTCSSRVSPVFPTNTVTIPKFNDGKRRWILFTGPIFPGNINADDFPCIFLSLGLFNVIIFSDTESDAVNAKEFAKDSELQWEQWTLDGSYLTDVNYSASDCCSISSSSINSVHEIGDSLKPAIREYSVLIGTAIGRASLYAKFIQSDLERFDKLFCEILSYQDLDEIAKQGQVVIANAMLSRHTSQTYSGISPIIETECHFWTHSLLGIGVPSLALVRIRQFVEQIFADSRLNARLKALSEIPPESSDLRSLSGTNEYWDKEHLFRSEIENILISDKSSIAVLPLVTCFSGRDGFRSTKLSLSAPLEVITNCNTIAWTPLTITHEISHTIIDGALGILLPRPDISSDLDDAICLLNRSKQCSNTHDQLVLFLCHALWMLYSDRTETKKGNGSTNNTITAEDLANIIREEWADLNETITHVFDFLYFYQRNPELYVPSIWASWGVIPNIQSRVPAYIVRTLCAVHATNLRTEDGSNHTIDQVINILKDTRTKYPNKLIESALTELEYQRDYYCKELKLRIPFIKLVRGFLYQPRVAQKLFHESLSASGDHEGYHLKSMEFNGTQISNPIRFITAYAKDTASNESRAAWILYHLAFGG